MAVQRAARRGRPNTRRQAPSPLKTMSSDSIGLLGVGLRETCQGCGDKALSTFLTSPHAFSAPSFPHSIRYGRQIPTASDLSGSLLAPRKIAHTGATLSHSDPLDRRLDSACNTSPASELVSPPASFAQISGLDFLSSFPVRYQQQTDSRRARGARKTRPPTGETGFEHELFSASPACSGSEQKIGRRCSVAG